MPKETQVDADGFITVPQRGKKKGKGNGYKSNCNNNNNKLSYDSSRKHLSTSSMLTFDSSYSLEELTKKIDEEIEDLRISRFYKELKESTLDIESFNKCQEIVCYGIGKLDGRRSPRIQFSLSVLLKELLNDCPMYLYEPILSNVELELVKHYGIKLIETNENCKRTVDKNTLFFMPHCTAVLYDNLLSSNWSNFLTNISLIGNNLSVYPLRNSSAKMKQNLPHIDGILPFCKEIPFPSHTVYEVFNDTAIHEFQLHDVPSSLFDVKEIANA